MKEGRIRKSEVRARIMARKKLENEDLAELLGLLTPMQATAAAIIGLARMSWAVEGDPERLMADIDNMTRLLRG